MSEVSEAPEREAGEAVESYLARLLDQEMSPDVEAEVRRQLAVLRRGRATTVEASRLVRAEAVAGVHAERAVDLAYGDDGPGVLYVLGDRHGRVGVGRVSVPVPESQRYRVEVQRTMTVIEQWHQTEMIYDPVAAWEAVPAAWAEAGGVQAVPGGLWHGLDFATAVEAVEQVAQGDR